MHTDLYQAVFHLSVPSSYLEAAQGGIEKISLADENLPPDPHPFLTDDQKCRELCPYARHGECRYGEHCVYLHAEICDLCGRAVLHPEDLSQRTKHTEVKPHVNCLKLLPPVVHDWVMN